MQRIPAVAAPTLRQLPAFEHDVIERSAGQEPARGEAGMAGPDDDGGDVFDKGVLSLLPG